ERIAVAAGDAGAGAGRRVLSRGRGYVAGRLGRRPGEVRRPEHGGAGASAAGDSPGGAGGGSWQAVRVLALTGSGHLCDEPFQRRAPALQERRTVADERRV